MRMPQKTIRSIVGAVSRFNSEKKNKEPYTYILFLRVCCALY